MNSHFDESAFSYFRTVISRKKLYFLSLLSGLLFFLGWPPFGFTFILFFAFVPLLYIEHVFAIGNTKAKRTLLFGLSYLTFFIWNISTTWWVTKASIGGGAMAFITNSFFMAAVFWIFHVAKKRLLATTAAAANWLFPVFWLSFEFIHYQWELTWPWLSLGNAFADNPSWIQWYEFTGVSGGSLWVLAVNLMIFEWLKGNYKMVYGIACTILFPILFSFALYYSYDEKQNPVSVVVVQPNIDPYSEKFSGMNYDEQLTRMLELAKQKTDTSTDYLVFPETALTEDIWDNDFKQTGSYSRLKEFLKSFPKLKIVTGASTWHLYEAGEKLSASARKFKKQNGYYDAFNTAFQIDNTDSVQVYHKSKLVPGVERMPYPAVFGFLENFAIDLGGTSGSLGTQEERTVFTSPVLPVPGSPLPTNQETEKERKGEGGKMISGVAPVICFESIFGEFVSEFVRNGADLIFISTNDGWWGDTPGYRQHLIYGRLRAIETRRCIARSANTGVSCFINQRGDISQATEWWKPAVIKANINGNTSETFYVKHGDLIGRVCFYVSGIVLLLVIFMSLRVRFGAKQSRYL